MGQARRTTMLRQAMARKVTALRAAAGATEPVAIEAPQPSGPSINPEAAEAIARIGARTLLEAIAADLGRNKDLGAYDLVSAAVTVCGWETTIVGLIVQAEVSRLKATKDGIRGVEAQVKWEAVKAKLREAVEVLGT